jgi:cytochrome P450
MEPAVIDLKNPDLYAAGVPHEIFTRLRREDPLYWNPESDGRGFWCVTRYDDIVAISKDPARFSSARNMEAIGCSMSRAWASAPGVVPVSPRRR